MIPLVDLKAQYRTIALEIDAAIRRVLDHGAFVLGHEVSAFEQAFAGYVGTSGAVGVASGTAALRLALAACDIGPGHEVITTAHTFMATGEAISQSGATPVFVDIDPDTYNIDPQCVESAVTAKTRAIVPVHLYGHPVDIVALLDIARRRHLRLIEDAAQAHGAEYRGRRCGSFGDLGCFSFYPGKNLGAYGDAGAVTSNDDALLERVRRLRDHGRSAKYHHDEIGFAERMDGLQAAVLGAKLSHLDRWTDQRRSAARAYAELLAGLPLSLPTEMPGARHAYHLYAVRTPSRNALLAHLARRGIGAGIHYPVPLHQQPAYRRLGFGSLSLPHTERAAAEVLSLPLYPELAADALREVARAVEGFFSLGEMTG